ncbi:MAG TPA: alpha/beta hydrolase [Rhodocyclaceae bacterium]|nr:alpha/beta hydrolase [Rhodocyclaceae bacterium]
MKRLSLLAVLLGVLLSGCASRSSIPVDAPDPGQAGTPDVQVQVEGLGPCNDGPDRTLHLDSSQPLTILVHGCRGSAGKFKVLAEVLAFHGQQTACFSYDDRQNLMATSGRLAAAISNVSEHLKSPHVTVVGHSMGGLIARKGVVAERPDPVKTPNVNLRLVTISAPFAGIASANPCANTLYRVLSLGINDLACRVISGDKWYDITSASDFIRQPGELLPQVKDYLKVTTDERNTCRSVDDNGRCLESDYIFSLEEQRHPLIDGKGHTVGVVVPAGHVEIVGENGVMPHKLIQVLQENGVIRPTEPWRQAEFGRLLARLYGR